MLRTVMVRRHCTVAAAFLLAAAAGVAAQVAAPTSLAPAANFTVFIQGAPIGTEQVSVSANADGWTIRATGRLGIPVSLSTARFEVQYDRDWKPKSLNIEASLRGQPLLIATRFVNGSAISDITQAGQQTQKIDAVAADTVLLPNMFFGAYEALALRLAAVQPGTDLRAYVVPQVEVALTLTGVSDERIQTSARTIEAKRYAISFANPGGAIPAEIWVDEHSRLLRFRVPAQSLEVARDDVASVSSRVERLTRQTDQRVNIPANGFNLAATISKPLDSQQNPARRLPAVVLVPGSGPVDRDETVAGIAVFAQLANAIADTGFLVVRYDKRGIGQSGGRDESATVQDFAEDVRAVLAYLSKRKDVDRARIVVVGHSEGGFSGMLAASQEKKKVAGLVLIATPGTTGGELVLEQQRHLLDRSNIPEDEKQNRVNLQVKIQTAVLTGTGWESIPAAYRRQADTPWFRSFLTFEPGRVVLKVSQPMLILQGDRDRQVAVRHAQLLADLAKQRKTNRGVDVVVIDGINHLLVPAPSGEIEEYPTLPDKQVSAKLIDALNFWLKGKFNVDPAHAGR